MLLYVDKKKEKQKKIRRLLIILFCFFFLSINVFQFCQSLKTSNQSLTSYMSIRHFVQWFQKADVVYLFNSIANRDRAVIVISGRLNRENTQTLAFALSKLPKRPYNIFVSPQLEDRKMIKELLRLYYPKAVFVDTIDLASLLVSSEFQEVKTYIFAQSLYPKVLNFKHAHGVMEDERLTQFIDKHFAQFPQPRNKLEREAFSLQQFIGDYQEDLKQFVFNYTEPQFAAQNFFLQNIRVCAEGNGLNFVCSLSKDNSLKENLKKVLALLPKETGIKKVYLLTSDKIIYPAKKLFLAQDEGVYFYYQGIESILLSKDIKELDNIADVFYVLKEKAGFNPFFEAPDMHFYKFKIREVFIDEKV